ncbi:MAG: glycosyltransferase [Candidatus Competibacteraceae bacterium]
MQPLVSCLMPTRARHALLPRAVAGFLAQTRDDAELVIVSEDGVPDSIADALATGRVRHVPCPAGLKLGAKRNFAGEIARGEWLVHCDDDDLYAFDRLARQLAAMQATGAAVSGSSRVHFYEAESGRCWEYRYEGGRRPWVYGATLAYRREFWRRHPFPSLDTSEDNGFVWAASAHEVLDLDDPGLCLCAIHRGNTSAKNTRGAWWRPIHLPEIWRTAVDTGPREPPPRPSANHLIRSGDSMITVNPTDARSTFKHPPRQDIPTIAVARTTDLELPEYRAFDADRRLPRMRRWELPFVLFQSRLANTMAVLDCTINPVDFGARLGRLYPHVLYRHWNPIQNGRFCLPLGVPDEAFDRVFCVNTLEHLLRPQREALLQALAKKLKPGGWLALTSDYYFDSFWSDRAFLAAGMLRADRREVFNGFNKVTIDEWAELGAACGVFPRVDAWENPTEDDPTLFRQAPPFPHACIGGVFQKGRESGMLPGRRILLALLTWNTKDVSLDSVHAYLREAKLLQRLGQEPYLCVCDNGSTDGTAAALRELQAEIDIPHRFICNDSNRGNSVARNQIIDYLLECGADYLLFMDGDIEIVPFSSFAMLRYLENQGERLGCIGACSAGQTPYRERASAAFYSIEQVETTNLVAWTQYGMFRRQLFEEGIRFDEAGPFTGPGWGFEDNDLAFQIDLKAYANQRFFGMTYLHRDARSSVRIMKSLGLDVHSLYTERKRYMIDKWAGVPPIDNGPLRYVREVQIRL